MRTPQANHLLRRAIATVGDRSYGSALAACTLRLPRWTIFTVVILTLSAAALGVGASNAYATCQAAYESQGDNVRGAGNDVGTRAYIEGGSTLSSCGRAVATVSIQSDYTSQYPGGFQTGYIEATSNNVSDCGTGFTGIFTEYVPVGTNNYTCVPYAWDTFGVGDLFSVEHNPATGWQSFDDGYAELNNPVTGLGFGSGYSFARGETLWLTNLPTFYVTWGPGGETHWQYRTNSNGCCTSYTDVLSEATPVHLDTQDSDNDWYIGTPPSPFYIQWIG